MHRTRIPLFPLPAVLFPGARMPLHVFEPRYRRMVARCLEFDRRFGLLFHDADRFGPFLSEPGRIGTVAEIERFRILPDGRSLMVVRGVERLRIQDGVESETPYYEALAESYADASPRTEDQLRERRARSLQLFGALVRSLPERPGRLPQLDPEEEVSFRLAPTIAIDPVWQQSLLELRDEAERLERLDAVFQAAIDQHGGG